MLSLFLKYFGGMFLGWGLGANDSANVFGTAVSSRMVRFKVAAVCVAVCVVIGALAQGQAGIETLSKDLNSTQTNAGHMRDAVIMSLSAAFTVLIMTLLKLPASTSQAVVGAIIGVGLLKGDVAWGGLTKVFVCWVTTPLGAMFFSVVFYYLFRWLLRRWRPDAIKYDRCLRVLLLLSGCYGAYALGANNVANVTAVYVKAVPGGEGLTVFQAALLGGISIAAGALTYSKPVMMTVGNDIIKLDAFMAFITVISLAVTVYIYALIGVPVSTTQAIVGAVLGFGLIKGTQTINFRTLRKIAYGWVATPVVAGVFGAVAFLVSNLHYLPPR